MTPTTPTTTNTTTIRPRLPSDLPSCASLLSRVYAHDAYPVQGVSHAVEFLSSPDTLAAWVAEAEESEAATSSPPRKTNPILAHVSLSLPPPSSTDPAVLLWRSHSQSPSGPVAVLERLFVDPSARGQGLAGELLRAASAEAAKQGLRVVLFALIKDEGAMRLYERVGWREFGRAVYGYRDGEGREMSMEAVCFVGPDA